LILRRVKVGEADRSLWKAVVRVDLLSGSRADQPIHPTPPASHPGESILVTLPSHAWPAGPPRGRDVSASASLAGRMRRARVGVALLALLLLALEPPRGAASVAPAQAVEQEGAEYLVKALAIGHFVTRYVKWPETAHKSKDSEFVVAVLGKDPFGKSLQEVLKGKKVGDHPIKVVSYASVDELEDCHLLFVPASSEKRLPKVLEFFKGKPTLLVCESIAPVRDGAHIAITIEKSKPKLTIHPAEAKRAKLELSSELLKLADIIEDKGKIE